MKKYYDPKKHKKYHSKNHFGSYGMRESIIIRDGMKCRTCSMTRDEHKEKYNCDITVDHIDGNGRCSEKQNNNPDNLITLCKKCHGSKDGKRADYSKRKIYKGLNHYQCVLTADDIEFVKKKREKGMTLMAIKNESRFSFGTIQKICANHYEVC